MSLLRKITHVASEVGRQLVKGSGSPERARVISDAHKRFETAREKFDPKGFKRGRGYEPAEWSAIARTAGLKRPPSNRALGKLELYKFKSNPPDKLSAYYHANACVGSKVTTWPGNILGHVVWRGQETRKLNGGKSVAIRMKGVNGVLYGGTCNLTGGTYCNLKRLSGATQSMHDKEASWHSRSPRRSGAAHLWHIAKSSGIGTGYVISIGDPYKSTSKVIQTPPNLEYLKDWLRDNVGVRVSPNHMHDMTGLKAVKEILAAKRAELGHSPSRRSDSMCRDDMRSYDEFTPFHRLTAGTKKTLDRIATRGAGKLTSAQAGELRDAGMNPGWILVPYGTGGRQISVKDTKAWII